MKTPSIGEFWLAQMRQLDGDQKPLTPKQYGQLSYLERGLGARTRPVIEYAIKNWWRFSHKAAADAATFPVVAPHIGFQLNITT